MTITATETQKGPKYEVNLDGDIRPWPNPTITVPEIRVSPAGATTSRS